MTSLLRIEDLTVRYRTRGGEVEAVRNLSLTLERGESFALVGESGCGKSTVAMALLRHLGPFGHIAGGRILLEGEDILALDDAALQRLRGDRIAMVYQEPMSALNPSLTIERQLREVLTYKLGMAAGETRGRILDALREVRITDPESALGRYPHQLSGGQQQRVVIAMALLANPSLLILDEPTTALDVTVQAAITELLLDLRRKYGTTLIYISHNLGVVSQVCDTIGVMYLGELVEAGRLADVFARPLHPYTRGLLECVPRADLPSPGRRMSAIPGQAALPPDFPGGCRFAQRCAHHIASLCSVHDIELTPSDTAGHEVRCVRWREIESPVTQAADTAPADRRAPPERVLHVEHLSKQYEAPDSFHWLSRRGTTPPLKANDNVSFDVGRGRTIAIVGESGCGKTTLARMIMGLLEPTGGRIELLGEDVADVTVDQRSPRQIAALQMVFQNPDATLNPTHTIRHALGRAVAKLGAGRSARERNLRIGELLRMVELGGEIADRYPDQLSGGQKQRVAIARSIAGNPTLVVADEPVSSLDVSVQAAILNLLSKIQDECDTAFILISHDLGVVRRFADHVIVMFRGQVMESGTVAQIFQPPFHPYTEALLAATPVPDPSRRPPRLEQTSEPQDGPETIQGCRFALRCHRRIGAICDTVEPPANLLAPGHVVRCHLPREELLKAPL